MVADQDQRSQASLLRLAEEAERRHVAAAEALEREAKSRVERAKADERRQTLALAEGAYQTALARREAGVPEHLEA